MTTAIAVTDESLNEAWELFDSRRFLHGHRETMRDSFKIALSAALTPHGEEAAATPAPQNHLEGQPTAYLVKRYDLGGVLLDTELSFTKPVIHRTWKTEFVPLFAIAKLEDGIEAVGDPYAWLFHDPPPHRPQTLEPRWMSIEQINEQLSALEAELRSRTALAAEAPPTREEGGG